MNNTPIPTVNVNAAFHNIFWSISLDTTDNSIELKRYNRANIGNVYTYPDAEFYNIISQMSAKGNINAYNQPYQIQNALKCYFKGTTKSCIEQIYGGTLIPGEKENYSNSDGFWGGWGNVARCPAGQYVYGYNLKVEKKQGSDDDTGLNEIQLYCFGGPTLSSKFGPCGDWGTAKYCDYTMPVKGFKIKIEPKQGDGDDTAANDVSLYCSNGSEIHVDRKSNWGNWSEDFKCVDKSYVVGLITRVEDPFYGDDTALNGVRLICDKLS